MRDPLVLIYETLKDTIKKVHGKDFLVFDEFPTSGEFKKQNKNAANISYISGSCEKGLMREYVPHKTRKNEDGTYTVATETLRMDYTIQISFFANKKGIAQKLSTEFVSYLEKVNQIEMLGDIWGEISDIFLVSPVPPPYGDVDLWQVNQTWTIRGKLLTESIVNSIDLKNFKIKINNV